MAELSIRQAHRRLYRQISKDLGFSQIELTALMAVGDSLLLTPKTLSEETGLTTGAITAMVDRLVKAGYVFRKPNVRDGRSIVIYLTDRGSFETVTSEPSSLCSMRHRAWPVRTRHSARGTLPTSSSPPEAPPSSTGVS
jgi:hypothetical protein